jgi:transposase InsO family protein
MTPQNYYARRRQWQRQEVDVGLMLELVRAQRREQPRLGGRKIYHLIGPAMKKAGVKMGRDRVFEELAKAGLLVERRRSEWPKTTSFDPNLPVFKNLIKGSQVTGRNQQWVSDITYIRTGEGFMYLSLITDRWSRKIVGFNLGESLDTQSSLKALRRALKGLRKGEKPIHHSDRGCQYASHVYVDRVQKAGLRMSMTETNHSAENAMAERVNGILKQEYYLDVEFATRSQARPATTQGVRKYNTRRPHTELGLRTPDEVHG